MEMWLADRLDEAARHVTQHTPERGGPRDAGYPARSRSLAFVYSQPTLPRIHLRESSMSPFQFRPIAIACSVLALGAGTAQADTFTQTYEAPGV